MRLIDADAFDERVRIAVGFSEEDVSEDFKDGVSAALLLLKTQPTVDAEPVRHGGWIFKERKGIKEAWYQCSECNAYDLREIDATSHYCWACGAKMDGERREEDAAD